MRNPRRTAQTAAALMIGLGAGVGDRGPRRLAQHIGQAAGRQRRQRRLPRHRLGSDSVSRSLRRSRASRESRRRRPYTRASSSSGDRSRPSPRRRRPTCAARSPCTITVGQRGCGDGRGPAAGRHYDRGQRPPPRRLGGTGQIRPDGADDDQGRRDLQAQPARRQLRRRRPVLRRTLRQPASDRRPAQHAAQAPAIWAGNSTGRCCRMRTSASRPALSSNAHSSTRSARSSDSSTCCSRSPWSSR